MRSVVSAVFFLAMAPLGLMASDVEGPGQLTSNVQDTVTVRKAQLRHLRMAGGVDGGRGKGGRRGRGGRGGGGDRDDDDDDESSYVPSPTPPTNLPTDMETLLDLHNEARCLHNANPLMYSDTVAASAMNHARVLSSSCGDFYHSESEDRNGYGENLYLCWGSGTGSCYTPERAMTGLYDEEIKVDAVTGYGGHATQILWKSTTELGCAEATCEKDSYRYVYLVCQYNPPGNYMAIVEQEVELPGNGNSC